MIREAIILAGGLGTRLKHAVNNVPKSMAPINGKPFLEYQLAYIAKFGINHVILSVGYMKEAVMEHFGKMFMNIQLEYAIEGEPLGTGGAVMNSLPHATAKEIMILNGDSVFRVDLLKMSEFHYFVASRLTIAVKHLNEAGRFGTVEFDKSCRILSFHEKKNDGNPGYINGGIYILDRSLLEGVGMPGKFSLEKDLFEKICHQHPVYAFPSGGYFLDIGVPEDYRKANDDFTSFSDR